MGPYSSTIHRLILILGLIIFSTFAHNVPRQSRSIELSVVHPLITSDTRLSSDIKPTEYVIDLRPNIEESTFTGVIKMNLTWTQSTHLIEFHAHYNLDIRPNDIKVTQINSNDTNTETLPKLLTIRRADRMPKKPIYQVFLKDSLPAGTICEVKVSFSGTIWETAEGMFKGNYVDENGETKIYLATNTRPNFARKLFPCFDSPEYKLPITFSVSRPKGYTTLFNVPIENTKEMTSNPNYMIDTFIKTPEIATFGFGFVISPLQEVNSSIVTVGKNLNVRLWARKDFHDDLKGVYEKIQSILEYLQSYWGVELPMCKLDIVALPGCFTVKPIDNWGLIVFKESDLISNGYYTLALELTYQWLGEWVSPTWWSDAHINKATNGFIAASAVLEIDQGREFDGKWPMTILYSIYYEFSKRYPHSRITGMKQETISSKTELVLRMLNYTIGGDTFRNGLRKFFEDRKYSTFQGDEVWDALTIQAQIDKKLPEGITINDIITSWITKDRLPVVTVNRNYDDQTAQIEQRVYLRERPHDVPEQDKMLWWIPLVVVTETNLHFTNTTPYEWIKKTRNVTLLNMPDKDKFIIVNPEEIGPYPVNYDIRNWNLLATFLQRDSERQKIPVYTRAKLLHDAWNLAYAGDLSFATAFNMTLFMKSEREHLVWNPVFTLIDHIGRHIDMSAVHKKFETYVRILLTPLYEELGPEAKDNEEKWKENLRSLAKTFLCRAGYRPCIEEAQNAYQKWMNSTNPDEGNPVPNQYICPVFKWGTRDEWEFGLQRVMNFPASRKQSERTYLLKTLAGCPIQQEKIERLLNITILESNENFSENDVFLIFSMLSGGSSGYTTLFNFLSNNWDGIKHRFENNTNLWDNLIGSATGVFTTQEGYDMVSELYVQRQGEFGSAEHIIEKSLKNIKEETKWSDENLPVIEQWLDDYFKTVNATDVKFMGLMG